MNSKCDSEEFFMNDDFLCESIAFVIELVSSLENENRDIAKFHSVHPQLSTQHIKMVFSKLKGYDSYIPRDFYS